MALSCCCRADFLLGFLRHLGNDLGCVVIELFGLTIGDRAAFDGGFSYGSQDRSDERPDYQRTGTNCQPGQRLPPFTISSNNAIAAPRLSDRCI
jgi:hypothetical protein